MKGKKSSSGSSIRYSLFLVVFLGALLLQQPAYATTPMSGYCVMPPYVKKDIIPNILLIMDNNTVSNPVGNGMQDPAYCTVDSLSNSSLVICNDQYDPTKTYSGYFRSDLNYSISSGEWTPDSTATGIFSGNILNWAATSKYDLLESILVGGVSTSRVSNPNDLHFMSNTWTKTFKYNNNDGCGVRTCIFTMDTVKGLSIGETTLGACGYLDSSSSPGPSTCSNPGAPHPFNAGTGQIVASLGHGADMESLASHPSGQGRRADASLLHIAAKRVLGVISYVIDLFSSDAEAAKNLAIQGGNANLTSGSQCVSGYSSGTIEASGGSGSGYTWSISGRTAGTYGCDATHYPIDATNSGLCMGQDNSVSPAGAVITGKPMFSGTKSFTLVVTDSAGHTDSKQYSISVTAATVTISTTTLPNAVAGAPYWQQVFASGACVNPSSGPTTWTASAGIPAGMQLNPNNTSWTEPYVWVEGTPTTAATDTFTLTVTDAGGNTASQQYSLIVRTGGNLVLSPGSALPSGTVGTSYLQYFFGASQNCNSGTGWTWSSSGTIPPGLTLYTNSGAGIGYTNNSTYVYLLGTPTTAGTYSFTLSVQDCTGSNTASKTFTITIGGTSTNPPRASYGPGKMVCVARTVSGTTYTCNTVRSNNCSSYSSLGSSSPCYNQGFCGTDKCLLRSGIVDNYWEKARFGLMDFNQQGGSPKTAVPNIEDCTDSDPTSPYPDSSFMNSIETAVPIDPTTTLVKAEYSGINDYYAQRSTNKISAPNPTTCDPIDPNKPCRQNFILMLTAGIGANNPANPSPYVFPEPPMPSGCSNAPDDNPILANLSSDSCFGTSVDLRSDTFGADDVTGTQLVNTYIVNTMGPTRTISGYDSNGNPIYQSTNTTPATTGDMLAQAAAKGGGKYYEVTDPTQLEAKLKEAFDDIIKRAAAGTAASVLASGEGSGANLIQAVFYPRREFYNMSTGDYDEIAWVGRLTNLWYYVDPFFNSSYIREDSGTKVLNLQTPGVSDPVQLGDYIVQMYFDQSSEATKAKRFTDTNGDGAPDAQLPTDIKFEALGNLWEAGLALWNQSPNSRTIYTTTNDTSLTGFTTTNNSALQQYLQAGSADEASKIISWVRGYDKFCSGTSTPCTSNTDCTSLGVTCSDTSYRQRTVTVNLCSNANVTCESDSDCPAGSDLIHGTCSSAGTNVWKLGDILNSTPKISSWIPLNAYDTVYNDRSYASFVSRSVCSGNRQPCSDASNCPTGQTCDATSYSNRGMVFAGGNDGMLHAFKLGKLELPGDPDWSSPGTYDKARLVNPDTGAVCSSGDTNPCGKEMWAFIPKNALPYLTYETDPDYASCHIYSVDLTPVVFDASIGSTGTDINTNCTASQYWNCGKYDSSGNPYSPITNRWRTILIGGMRSGGACKQTCADSNCVPTPATDAGGNPVGYSSYFALDVTDPGNPTLLWEFSSDSLGYATTGPAIVRVNARKSDLSPDKDRNGRWLVVFGSGPTGGIDATNMQFLGNSDQPLKLFVFDLVQGPGAGNANVTTFDASTLMTGNAFAGSLLNAAHDSDTDYQDDVVYVPYVRQCNSSDSSSNCTDTTTWTNGGVLRLRVKDAASPSASDIAGTTALSPANWRLSTLMDDAGPVSSAVVRLENTAGELWTFFGSGRYYYEQGSNVDDPSNRRRIFGVKDPCFTASGWKSTCTSLDTVSSSCGSSSLISSLLDVTNNPDATPDDLAPTALTPGFKGWCIWLDPEINPGTDPEQQAANCTNGQWGYNESNSTPPVYVCRSYHAEREITDPLATSAGLVFFTTYKPYTDECFLGGKSFIWAVKYNTGAAPGAMLKGVALLQVSTGSIEQLNMSSAFTSAGGRRSTQLEGVPPTARGLSIMVGPPPVKRVVHMREK